jgi:hypothetical protein
MIVNIFFTVYYNEIFRGLIENSLQIVEDSPTDAFFNALCFSSGVTETKLLSDYKLFKISLQNVFGSIADEILTILEEEIEKYNKRNNTNLYRALNYYQVPV